MLNSMIGQTTHALAVRMQEFEAAESVVKTGTGSRREGEGFERLVGEFWDAVREDATNNGAACSFVGAGGNNRWARLSMGDRVLLLPSGRHRVADPHGQPHRWLEVAFGVSELLARFPGSGEATVRYAPDIGDFAGASYPEMYSGLSTKFDDTIVLEEANMLKEKLLLEYKTAKSSAKRQLDGNAHERLTFQMMQYLEVATRYSHCSLTILANGAFAKYRNKYHPNFHVQAERLQNFAWFTMDHACTARQFCDLAQGLLCWLIDGTDRRIGSLAK